MRRITYFIISLVISIILISCESSKRFTSELSFTNPDSETRFNLKSTPKKQKLNSFQKSIIGTAEDYLGTPYCFGGESDECFDCSGFVQKVFLEAGIKLPRTSSDQFEFTTPVPESDRRPGDLIFFRKGNRISHVGIYIGNNYFIHSSTTKGVVKQSIFEDYYIKNLAGFGRVGNEDDSEQISGK